MTDPPQTPAPRARGRQGWLAAGVAALSAVGYANALGNQFLLDDHVVLFGPKGVANLELSELFASRQHLFYRPVGHLFLLASHRLFGESAPAYHAANLLLLLAMAWLTYRIARELGAARRPSLLATLLFALHPLHAFLVDYVTASVISTFVLLLQASFLLYLRFRASGQVLLQAASLLAFAGALLSHEMAIVLPLVIAAHEWLRRGAPALAAGERAAAHLLIAAAYLALRAVVFPLTGSVGGTLFALREPARYLASLWDLLAWYLPKLVWPRDLLFLWSAPFEPTHRAIKSLALLVSLALLLAWLVARRRRRSLPAFLVAMFAAGLLPLAGAAFSYFPQSSPLIEPHWFYFPSIGLFVLAGTALDRLFATAGPRAGAVAVAGLLATALLLLRETNGHWRDEETYSRHWLSLNDRDWTPYHGLGRVMLRRGEYAQAAEVLNEGARRISRAVPSVLAADLGYAAHRAGRREEGRRWLSAALRSDPGYARSWYYVGLIALDAGDLSAAERCFERASLLFPASDEYRSQLSGVRSRLAASPAPGAERR